jgi:glycogen operon protein
MTKEEWHAGWIRCFGLWLNGRTLDEVNAIGEPILDDSFLVLFNSHHAPVRFTLPQPRPGVAWELCLDTRTAGPVKRRVHGRKQYQLVDRSMAILQERSLEPAGRPTL